jgi:hypothetical protein
VVLEAINMLLKMGRIPRYQVDAGNTPSVQLAKAIGLMPILRFEHYLAVPKVSRS